MSGGRIREVRPYQELDSAFVRSEESWRSRWACYPRRITPSEISIILYIILKPNPIVLLFIQNNSYFKNKLKHAYLHQCQFYVIISSSAGCVDPRIVSTRRDAGYFLVKFLENSGYKGMFRLACILQIADVIRQVVFLLLLLCCLQ